MHEKHPRPAAAPSGGEYGDHEPRLGPRIVELETRLAFQDQALSVLNDTVVDQARAIEALTRRLDAALGDLGKLRTMLFADPGEEPAPPHY